MCDNQAIEREGVVKFSLVHTPGPAPGSGSDAARYPALPELFALRDALRAEGLIGVNAEGVGYGNVSVRGAGPCFVISGTGTGGVERLGAEGYCLVTACDATANRVHSLGPTPASSESMTHWAVYAARPEARVVAHVHHRELFDRLLATGAAATARDIAYGTPAMALAVRELAASLPACGLLVMAGHDEGVLAYGPDAATVHNLIRQRMTA